MKQVRMVKSRSQEKEEEVECETELEGKTTGVFVPKDLDRYTVEKKEGKVYFSLTIQCLYLVMNWPTFIAHLPRTCPRFL